MSRRPLLAIFAALLLCTPFRALAADLPEPRLVRVTLDRTVTVPALLQAGLDVASVHGGTAMLYVGPEDDSTLARLGARVELVDAHPGATAAARAHAELAARPRPVPARIRSAVRSDGRFRIESLPPFGSGSLAGYWTLDEVKMKLDSLVASDVNDVVADQIDTLGSTWQGRPIWGLMLGKRVTGPDSRPIVYYNSLTHAREPGGMEALFYFVDDLLSGYGTDPWKTYLLDHRRIYICPVVNPDGYQINVNTYVSSGGTTFGMWRKNARDNNGNLAFDTGDGVDINRNFGYQWGIDNIGSSGTPSSDIYRGPSAFSEPETRAQRDKIIALQPATALSFHTYSDLFLHPWGYQVPATSDSALFYQWDDEATLGNGYASGQSTRVLYQVNGEFNDWCYGETVAKPRIYSWTPETGNDNDGFWPPASRIVTLAQENLRECYTVAGIAGPYVRLASSGLSGGSLLIGNVTDLLFTARNIGRASTATGLHASLLSLDPGAEVLVGSAALPQLVSQGQGSNGAGTFRVATVDTLTPGRLIRFLVEFRDDAGLYCRDTLTFPAGVPTNRLIDNASGGVAPNWTVSGLWGTTSTGGMAAGGLYFADSPAGNYPANYNASLTLKNALDLSPGVHAYANFYTRWGLEQDYDATVLEVTLNNGATWTPAAGRASTIGIDVGVQPVGKPVYEGQRHLWAFERVDLSPFCGPTATAAKIRFRTLSDSGTQFDGFNFDTLTVQIFDPSAQPSPVAVAPSRGAVLAFAAPSPNPARTFTSFAWTLPAAGNARLEVLDLQGRRVALLADGAFGAEHYVVGWDLTGPAGRRVAPGVYLARLTTPLGARVQRLAVLR